MMPGKEFYTGRGWCGMESILKKIEDLALSHDKISPQLIREKDIKLGLRNPDGTGVVVGITSKGTVLGYDKIRSEDGTTKVVPIEGKLLYCGYDVIEIARQIHSEKRYGFDEVAYLLLTGELPGRRDLTKFTEMLVKRRALSKMERSVLMQESENYNQMYALHSLISHLSRCDKNPDSTDIRDVSKQCINIIAKFPTIVAYNYQVMKYRNGANFSIIVPDPELSTAENFLYMLRGKKPTEFESLLFDMCLILHADHGGGNNSTFTVRTVSSSGANTYMAICSGIASLSGHLHGGANEAVMKMMKVLKSEVRDLTDDDEIKRYLVKILEGKVNDRSGKIYGMGHAVYTISDPRAIILREKAEEFAAMKGVMDDFHLFDRVSRIAPSLFKERKGINVAPNVDFWSGFIYRLMGIPQELFTPIFAMARSVGWSAHRIEQIVQDKIIRPAYVSSLKEQRAYRPLSKRK
jgi:citrate synthase